MQESFEAVRSALEDHLQAINENSSEIQALFDYLQDMEIKIDKLNSRLDALQLEKNANEINISPLNEMERQLFLVLYTAEGFLDYTQISRRSKIPVACIAEHLRNLSIKGVPLLRTLSDKQILVQLDSKFKEKQAKENIINLSLDTFF